MCAHPFMLSITPLLPCPHDFFHPFACCQCTRWHRQLVPGIFGVFPPFFLPSSLSSFPLPFLPSLSPCLLSLQISCEKSCSQAHPRGNGTEKQCLFSSLSSYTVKNNSSQAWRKCFAGISTSAYCP